VIPQKENEKDYIKLIKTTLAKKFSEQMEQDLPVGEVFPLFPDYTQAKLDSVFSHNKERRAQFYFNLLQAKALCAPVGKDMIKDEYSKHKKSLCRPPEEVPVIPDHHLQGLREYGKKVGKRVNQLYDPFKSTLPNGRACVEKGRHLGGNLSQLKETKNCQLFNNHPITQMDGGVRLEPYVIGLFGQPGSGKTTLVQTLVRLLGKTFYPGLEDDMEKLRYSRSCSTDHWDGYTGQPIVVLDDFGQNHASRQDIVEFENIVSINDYVLPMAELSDKGQKFVSPFIILTSNCQYGSNLQANNSTHVEEPWAVWRRITLPLNVHYGQIRRISYRPTQRQLQMWSVKHSTTKANFTSSVPMNMVHDQNTASLEMERIPGGIRGLFDLMVKEIHDRFDYHQRNFQDIWVQSVSRKRIECTPSIINAQAWEVYVNDIDLPSSDLDWSLDLQFPSRPPSKSPVVKAVALSEPLKVRMITAAEARTKVLQPLQRALRTYLEEQPQFCLTGGAKAPWSEHESFEEDTLPWIYRIETMIKEIQSRTPENSLWLSGDYTAATDNFPMAVTEALIQGILSEIDHEPTREWVRWECSSHEILYPDGVKGFQTSGQLMGSLLSFPLLCFLNDYIVSYSGFKKYSYLINGDDVVARGGQEEIDTWRAQAPQVGLSLSLGKNFIDPDFCTVNSQLFYKGDVLHTGKVSCQTRVGTTLSYCFEETQFYWGTGDWVKYEFLKRNLPALRETPRSLHLSKKHGGLGLVDSIDSTSIRYDHSLMKRVYLYDLLQVFDKSIPLPGGDGLRAVPIPVLRDEHTRKKYDLPGAVTMNKLRSLMPQEASESGDLSNGDLRKFEKKVEEHFPQQTRDHIRSIVKQGKYHIRDFPPRDFYEVDYVFVQSGRSRHLLEKARQLCLTLFEYVLNNKEVPPLTWEGGDLNDLPGIPEEERKYREIFQDRNLLTENPTSLEDLDLTEDVADWFEGVNTAEIRLKDAGTYAPLPSDHTSLFDFLATFSSEVADGHTDQRANLKRIVDSGPSSDSNLGDSSSEGEPELPPENQSSEQRSKK
jgi:energy-coupling factor transporter ATP-binding protein EcfA2